jgi:adenylate cyclase
VPVKMNRVVAAFMRSSLREAMPGLLRRMEAVADGRATPTLESMSIGSGRKVSAAIIFFDICGFTQLTDSDDPQTLKRTLLLLNCVIPAMMRVLYRYDAYVEKNTGDGLMAVLGVETDNQVTANHALDIAEEMFFVCTPS